MKAVQDEGTGHPLPLWLSPGPGCSEALEKLSPPEAREDKK